MDPEKIQRTREDLIPVYKDLVESYWRLSDKYRAYELYPKILNTIQGDLDTIQPVLRLVSSSESLFETYYQMIWFMLYTLAAQELMDSDKYTPSRKVYIRARIQNQYSSHCMPQFLRFLDHVAFHIYFITEGQIFKKQVPEHKVAFRLIRRTGLMKNPAVGPLNVDFIKTITSKLLDGIDRATYRRMIIYRNCYTHKFDIGIDHMTTSYMSELKAKKLTVQMPNIAASFGNMNFYSAPLIEAKTLMPLIDRLLINSLAVMTEFCQSEAFKMHRPNSNGT